MNLVFLKSKKIFICISIVLIFSVFFAIFYYKNKINGNNINIESKEDIIAYVKNINQYKANIQVTVYSNKNENNYEIYQEVTKEKSIQIVDKPKNIEKLTIEQAGNTVTIKNTKLNLEKIYKNYIEYFSNLLFLDSFSKELEVEKTDIDIKENSIILKLEHKQDSTYRKYSELELDKKTMKPIKLEVKDKNKKTIICILYTDIEIN